MNKTTQDFLIAAAQAGSRQAIKAIDVEIREIMKAEAIERRDQSALAKSSKPVQPSSQSQ